MRTMRSLLLIVLVTWLGSGWADAKDATLVQRVSTFKKALRSKDPKARSRAFEYLRGSNEPAVIDHLTWGLKQVEGAGAKIHKQQETVELGYEKFFSQLQDANTEYEASNGSSRDMDRYNKKAKKIAKGLDDAVLRLKNLENDFTRNRAMIMQGVLVAAELLERLAGQGHEGTGADGDAFADALARVTTQWLHAKPLATRLRWFDAVSEVGQPSVAEALRAVSKDAALETVLRVRAVDALAARRDGPMFGAAIAMLKLPLDQQPLVLAAIRVLRTMHDKRGIVPLIGFLARQDIKRSRGDAHLALISLTGVDHGPHPGQWTKWWEDNTKTFTMPKEPKTPGRVKAPEKGKTFYGIPIYSDKILFIVDISGSMDKQARGKGAKGRTKMEILKQELTGTIFNLNATDTFNVVFFNHQVIPWQKRKIVANERNKRLLKDWVTEQKPLGGTNIFDALELGFKIAHRVTGPPDLDTIYFLTDGKPTAGKIRDPKRILEIMKAWNETGHLTINTIGIGKGHDAEFLKALARIGDGTYIRR